MLDEALRACTKCNIVKPATAENFGLLRRAPSGLHNWCRECLREADRAHKRGKKIGRNSDVASHQKRCPKCKQVKDRIGNFRVRTSGSWTGVHAWCAPCERADGAARARADHARRSAYYAATRERSIELSRARYQRCKKNPEWVKRKNERSRDTSDPERQRLAAANWRERNKVRIAERNRLWRQNNSDTYKEGKRNYRARKRGALGSHTQDDVQSKLSAQKNRCWWCKCALDRFEVDHLIPLSKGGTNGPENIVISCGFCNRSKGAKMPWEFSGRLL